MIENYQQALNWAIQSFKSRAFKISSSQLEQEIDDILTGKARIKVNWSHFEMVYAEQETPGSLEGLRYRKEQMKGNL